MIAAWQVRPPRLVTIAAARFITGSQSGSVMSVTSTSPSADLIHLRRGLDQPHGPCPIFWPIARPLASTSDVDFEPVAAQPLPVLLLRFHGLRPRLQDVELAVDAVAAPFDVHRPAVMPLDDQRGSARAPRASASVIEKRRRSAAGTSIVATDFAGALPVGEHHFAAPCCRRSLRRIAGRPGGEVRLVHVELVGVHGALDDGLAEAVRRGDEHDLIESGFGVEREHHAGGAEIAAHHALDRRRRARRPRGRSP